MQIPVLVEPVANNGYRARGFEPLALSAEGATSEEALENLQKLIDGRLKNGTKLVPLELNAKPADNPWLAMAGMYDPGDATVQEWKEEMKRYREEVETDPEY